jgi:hypothetical protein
MTEEKKSKNPFINMANAAKKSNSFPSTQQQNKAPKPNKGFGGANTMRKTGRGR